MIRRQKEWNGDKRKTNTIESMSNDFHSFDVCTFDGFAQSTRTRAVITVVALCRNTFRESKTDLELFTAIPRRFEFHFGSCGLWRRSKMTKAIIDMIQKQIVQIMKYCSHQSSSRTSVALERVRARAHIDCRVSIFELMPKIV